MIQQDYFEYLKVNYPDYLEHYINRKKTTNYIVDDFNTGSEEDYLFSIAQKDAVVENYLENYIKSRYDNGNIKLFNKVEIETINRCNNDCAFCPINVNIDKRKHILMSDELFNKIINELVNLDYSGALAIFSNNEPLLDPKIFERLKFAKYNLKKAYIYIYTNGLLLTEEKLELLLKYTDFLYINNYNKTDRLLPTHKKVHEYLIKNHIEASKVEIHLRNKFEHLSSRAGTSPNRKKIKTLKSKCILPFSQIVIRPSGKISFCCNDACANYTMDDVNNNSLLNIWNGKEFNKLRNNMNIARHAQIPCQKCDMLYMPLAFEEQERK